MTVQATVAAFQALHRAIAGVTSAPAALPGSANETDLPLVITKPAEATWSQQAVGLKRQERAYLVYCLVAPVALGDAPDTGFQACLPLLQAFGEAYLNDLSLGGAVDHLGEVADGGVEVLTFAGVHYHGFIYRVTAVEK